MSKTMYHESCYVTELDNPPLNHRPLRGTAPFLGLQQFEIFVVLVRISPNVLCPFAETVVRQLNMYFNILHIH